MVADEEDDRSIRGVSVARSHGSVCGASVVSKDGCVSRIHYAGEVFTPEIDGESLEALLDRLVRSEGGGVGQKVVKALF